MSFIERLSQGFANERAKLLLKRHGRYRGDPQTFSDSESEFLLAAVSQWKIVFISCRKLRKVCNLKKNTLIDTFAKHRQKIRLL